MAKTVADGLGQMLSSVGITRCYGVVGDALNPVMDVMRRNAEVEFIYERNEEYGVAVVQHGSTRDRRFSAAGQQCHQGFP
jgi:glyoxylate carboligase